MYTINLLRLESRGFSQLKIRSKAAARAANLCKTSQVLSFQATVCPEPSEWVPMKSMQLPGLEDPLLSTAIATYKVFVKKWPPLTWKSLCWPGICNHSQIEICFFAEFEMISLQNQSDKPGAGIQNMPGGGVSIRYVRRILAGSLVANATGIMVMISSEEVLIYLSISIWIPEPSSFNCHKGYQRISSISVNASQLQHWP